MLYGLYLIFKFKKRKKNKQIIGAKINFREGKNPDYQLRSIKLIKCLKNFILKKFRRWA